MKSRIVIAGSLAQRPWRGGHTWVFLQYLLGFARLGYDILFLDRLESDMAVDRRGRPVSPEQATNLEYVAQVMSRVGLGERWAVSIGGGREFVGRSRRSVRGFVRSADVLINVMGFLEDDDLLGVARRRVFLDIDPGFPQLWAAQGLADPFAGHDAFVTVGLNVGSGGEVPDCGLPWVTTVQPVVLEHWPADPDPGSEFTTAATWRGDFGTLEHGGRRLGLRCHEFRRFLQLPSRTGQPFKVALDIHPDESRDLARLRAHGWKLVDPLREVADPWRYRGFIRASAAELMVAKELYVLTRGGWFSDRSICYLATGRPVLAQDTGYPDHLPTGEGLVPFSDLDEAVTGVQSIATDPARHARAAREIAETHFDSDRVLSRLMDRLDAMVPEVTGSVPVGGLT